MFILTNFATKKSLKQQACFLPVLTSRSIIACLLLQWRIINNAFQLKTCYVCSTTSIFLLSTKHLIRSYDSLRWIIAIDWIFRSSLCSTQPPSRLFDKKLHCFIILLIITKQFKGPSKDLVRTLLPSVFLFWISSFSSMLTRFSFTSNEENLKHPNLQDV